jgi:Flp pilus assembly protein TadG
VQVTVRQHGQSTLEFALVLPIFLGLTLAVFELGRYMAVNAEVTNGIRAGARAAIVRANNDNAIKDRVVASAALIDKSALRSSVTISPSPTRNPGTSVTVSASYAHAFLPFVSRLTRANLSTVTITHSATMTVE